MMNEKRPTLLYSSPAKVEETVRLLQEAGARLQLAGLCGSAFAVFLQSCAACAQGHRFLVLSQDKEKAAFLYHDLELLFHEEDKDSREKQVFFFPSSYKKHSEEQQTDSFQVLMRTQLVAMLPSARVVVSYPEAVCEKVVSGQQMEKESFSIRTGERLSMDDITDFLSNSDFEYSDYVCQPGDFAVRGGIIDVFSYLDEHPYRIVFNGDTVDSIRQFDIRTQASTATVEAMRLLPKPVHPDEAEAKVSLFSLMKGNTSLWTDDMEGCLHQVEKNRSAFPQWEETKYRSLFLDEHELLKEMLDFPQVGYDGGKPKGKVTRIPFRTHPQDRFNQSFHLLVAQWIQHYEKGIVNYFGSDNANQRKRIGNMLEEMLQTHPDYRVYSAEEKEHWRKELIRFAGFSLHEGFTDEETGIAFYTDHQVFNRYHRYRIEDKFQDRESLQLSSLNQLQVGDYVTHINYGIGRFAGLEKIDNNGRVQEAIKILYRNNDALYISIHALNKIAKYSGKDGMEPTLSRLGGSQWNKVKERTKEKVKEMVIDLTRLYAERKATEGFAFSQDSYLQEELEASFMYEDTPDQLKATQEIKKDMEAPFPMDRLVCGDVGFGKTEVAIRAAFKAVCDSKQVAVLVPTTVLALQHYHSFLDRLQSFPCRIAYLNRFTTAKMRKEILENVREGKIDILIGTHRMLGKDIVFKDLGLLIIDEEQKFGVEAKEKLRSLKVNIDTLTMTATPIPRTLQFSLMGARDISIMQTPPLNRYPIQTELHRFDEDYIREGISQEICRGGQVFFVHNRVQDLFEIAGKIQALFPEQSLAVAHGQMDGGQLEKIMIDFIDGMYDILVCTTIIESGLDIPNANTIFINEAQNYGLSDLHQLRGRVGRKNKKAFCYLLTPPLHTLSENSRKRLRAIEEFSDIGSGFQIAMRDLDIRGAGNLLGAEQSGFITEIGYEMYQKILEEAVYELHNRIPDIPTVTDYVRDCTLETDLRILIPDSYVSNSNERLMLYKDINALRDEEAIGRFKEHLQDRFGPIPPETAALFQCLRLRWTAKKIGFEKVLLKHRQMICHFLKDEQSPYFESAQFQHILNYLQHHPSLCRIKEEPGKLSLTFGNVPSVEAALSVLHPLQCE
ncbi:MAG: transcription-repair coupling factor [Bacteroidales bacterium]|nr:transcription-repair coupling factor [Bacteroidales bacterium]